ncbi:Protein SAP1 [Spathaspora sp. JA1]|nr:Protein SAP1 [Spathaspora sp. JA1]
MFMRKKPPKPSTLEELQETYTDCCDQTIKNLTLEENGNFEESLKGWKSLHTSLLYKIVLFQKTINLSTPECNILNDLRAIRDQNVKHLIRVQLRLDELNRIKNREASGAPPPPPPRRVAGQTPRNSIPSLRSTATTNTASRTIMKSLRNNSNGTNSTNKNTNNSSSFGSASVKQAEQAATVSWQKPITWKEKTKSYSKSKIDNELFQDFDQDSYEVNGRGREKSSSRSSTGITEYSTSGPEDNLIDLEDDQIHKFNSIHPDPFKYGPETAISKSMDDLTIKPIETPPDNKPYQKSDFLNPSDITKPKHVSKSSSDIPQEKTKKSSTNKPYVYNKPKPMNLQKLMQQSSSKHHKPTKAVAHTPIHTPPAAKQKTKPTSNITYNYVKVSPPAKKNETSKPIHNGHSVQKPAAVKQKVEEPPLSPTMDDLLSAYDDDDTESKGSGIVDALTSEKEQDKLISSIRGIDPVAAKQILTDIVVHGDEVYWDDIIGLESAKESLKEAVVYPFLRPDLFRGLREPTRGMLLFGPPGTGKTMLARAVATESHSTFFSISASSLTSKYLGESEKLVKALFLLARKLAPSIVFMDEIDSLLGSRTEGELESMRRIKNEFLVSWSELSSAAAGRDSENDDVSRVLVLGATNLPWSIDEAARRRFVRRQYIPLPEGEARMAQIKKLLQYQKNTLSEQDFDILKNLTEGFSGSDITALAKDSAMGPLRVLGEKLLSTPTDQIRPICLEDFVNSLNYIRPSVSKEGLQKHEEWARKFGSSGV